ncbi:hypothetical protein LHYA1_G005763 [Lachnellula hyalina]|uniref:Rhodopsin domain-containing protein n=1 Tax=Lachnellula hyalina TaxID=1316788 RepID=A0A8H8QZ56_9HELO|nr:uncharacterized protein LHYA1_G005763 [Lachnellula hyalina]TVY25562.1 hypothetical protein LHYA1_G005763 [Lachnellula hyalina]
MFLSRQSSAPVGSGPVSTDSHGARILGITSFFTAFACTAVILRVYVRIFMLKMMGADDYVMLVAMVCSVAVLTFVVLEVQLGVGEHFGNPHLMMNYGQIVHWSYHHAWILIIGITCVKLSVGIFLLRLIQGKLYRASSSWQRSMLNSNRCIIGWMAFLLAFTFACVCTLIFQCLPVEAAWNFDLKANPKTKCYSPNVFRSIGLFNGAINLFTDFVFASLPIPVIVPLQINLRTKISLIFILSLGYFACAASIVKEYYLSSFFANTDNQLLVPPSSWLKRRYRANVVASDDTFNVWSFIEINAGILAACLPTLRPLFATLIKNRSILKYSDTDRTKVGGARHRYLPQQDDKELLSMPSRSTFNGTVDEDHSVGTSGGNGMFGDGSNHHGHDSVASSSPPARLGKAIEDGVGGEDGVMSRLQGPHRAYVQRGRDSRDWKDPGGIFRTTEFSVTR